MGDGGSDDDGGGGGDGGGCSVKAPLHSDIDWSFEFDSNNLIPVLDSYRTTKIHNLNHDE